MRVVLLLHGLKDPTNRGLLRLRETLESGGFVVRALNYGWFLLRGMGPFWYLFNMPLARILACFVELLHDLGHKVVIVAHSNGATIAMKASQLGAPFDAMVLVNAAVERNATIGDRTGCLLNCRAPDDPVLALSRILAVVSPYSELVGGSLGREGVPANADALRGRMWDVNMKDVLGVSGLDSHGESFSEKNANAFGAWILNALRVHANLGPGKVVVEDGKVFVL